MVIFDLDGTLLDTSKGIFNSVRYTEKQIGLKSIDEEQLKEFVGPPPKMMYAKKYRLSDEDALKAAQKHREYGLSRAIYEAEKYPQIDRLLTELRNKGIKLAVATLKKQLIAERVLENYNLIDYFDHVIGMNDAETYTKCQTIQKAMNGVECKNVIMVGDSPYDYEGAIQAGVRFVGALYGFGLKKEENYSFSIINKPIELLKLIEKLQNED